MLQLLLFLFVVIVFYNFGSSLLSAPKTTSTNRPKEGELPPSEDEENNLDYDSKISQLKYEINNEIEKENFARAHLKLAQLDALTRDKYEMEADKVTETQTKLYSLSKRAAEYISAGVEGFKNGFN